ncbi:hypothetical protein AB0F88_25200 [Streptosporangium sp. NPDC023963]|uniref:hypothetical protein n=1 Tax=Streptosporangium sp. NPDC023963 TaxID=3155608 RepID=UPI003440ACCF
MGYPPQYGQPPRGETRRGLVVMVVMAVGVAIGAVVTVFMVFNPPSSPPSTAAPTRGGERSEHSEASVRQAVQPALDAYSSGLYGDFWDLWTTEAQGLIAREEYVRLFEICPPILPNSPLTIAGVTITGDIARVQATRLDDSTDFDFVFEGGTWRYEPSPEERLTYQAPVDQIAEQRRAMGFCGVVVPTSAPGAPTPTPSITPSVPTAPSAPAVPSNPAAPSNPTDPTTQPPGFL